ncbi:coiled-coil domain-containing protein 62 isoform X4 [Hypomesus transpacificus]|uniref:coiled-coil domain-containing protein 62 isoform X4 n=1 Tax=Hypomesus transpacificus TaxID=137520 RepID=UPI001F086057|nr:coiled-coil domain-containing protein 62 isoform X4 [Hypomesus transpacificus]
MDRGTLNPNGSHGNSSSQSIDLPTVTQFDHWHSTPVKTSEIQDMTRRLTRSSPAPSSRTRHLIPQNNQTLSEMESATILKQRRELQLLIAELKDRDQELNTMAAAHRKQLLSWEQDRHRVLTLEQRNARLEDELQKRNEVIRAVTKHAHVVEAREKEGRRELNSTQQQLHEMGKKQQQSSQQYHHLEERIKSLNSTVMSLSAQVGALQVREEELSAMLRLKDKDVTEATNHIVDLSGRRKDLETSLKESGFRESRLLREAEENKRRYREARHASTRLKEELQEQVREGSAQREELIRLKQEGQLLRRELTLSGEGEDWKDELLGLARSKQERTDSELHCLRQLCENQQNDLQLLQLNLESARQALKQHDGSQGDLTCNFLDDLSPSSWTRRNLGPVIGSPATTNQRAAVNGNQKTLPADGTCCSTNRLQRLLAESREMVSSLERSALQTTSPSHNCDAVLGFAAGQLSGSSDSSHHASQNSPYHPASQAHKESGTPPRAAQHLNATQEHCGLAGSQEGGTRGQR